jgi:hypothetical protein
MREAFCKRIKTDEGKGYGREKKTERIKKVCTENKKQRAYDERGQSGTLTEQMMASRCTGIALINFPISDSVEEHGCCPGKDHAEQNQERALPARPSARVTPCGHHHRAKRKRQRKDRVRETNEGEKTGERMK